MIGIISATIALVGSIIAAIIDLKTTEIPDRIPHSMIISGIVLWCIASIISHNYWPILKSLIVGSAFLAFGFLLYYFGQWGGGDAKLLAAIGFLLPDLKIPHLQFAFPISFLLNLFFIGAIYALIYAIVLAIKNEKIICIFFRQLKSIANFLIIVFFILFVLFFALNFFISTYFRQAINIPFFIIASFFSILLISGLFIMWQFVNIVEKFGMRKRIPVSKLKVGDVLADSKLWEGVTKKEITQIKKAKKFVWIKEGVRFAPAFPLALLFTFLLGDAFLLFFRFLI